jgi:hypothetical protein
MEVELTATAEAESDPPEGGGFSQSLGASKAYRATMTQSVAGCLYLVLLFVLILTVSVDASTSQETSVMGQGRVGFLLCTPAVGALQAMAWWGSLR